MPTEYAMPYDAVDATQIQPLDAGGYVVDRSSTTGGADANATYEVVGTFREEGEGIYSPVDGNDLYSGTTYFPLGQHGVYDGGNSSLSYVPLAGHSPYTSGDVGGGYGPLDRHSTYAGGSAAPIQLPAVATGNAATRRAVATLAAPEGCDEVDA
jgi:hypothetical protein